MSNGSLDLGVYSGSGYRDDIQGIRAIGAILIMVYHIWFQKVSGGVDVFFVVSGYFMCGMLVRQYVKKGYVSPFVFWGRIIKRIAPLAYVVILATFLAGYFFLPPHVWRVSINEVLTSALHIENWQLIKVGANYLNSENPPSPLQQFWALSLQIQLYLVLPFVFLIGLGISKWLKLPSLKPLAILVCAVVVSSFAYSYHYTTINPAAAYFNTFTRGWEFFLGVLVFLVAPFFRFPAGWAKIARLLGVAGLVMVGILVPKTASYPGVVALFPVLSAVLLIISGDSVEQRSGLVGKMLSSKILVYIGGISFSLYLWHWPIFIYMKHYVGDAYNEFSLIHGLLVVALAFLFSVASKYLIESPASKLGGEKLAPYVLGALFFTPVFLGGYLVRSEIVKYYDETRATDFVQGEYFEGRSVSLQKGSADVDVDRMVSINHDLTGASLNGCSAGVVGDGVSTCEFGDTSQERSVLMVGGSRLAHWEPLYTYLGEKYGFRVITATINSCSFGYHPTMDEDVACEEWNGRILDLISSIDPEPMVVIANSTRNDDGGSDFVPDGYVESWKEVIDMGIPVVGIRAPARLEEPNSCLWKNLGGPTACAVSKYDSLSRSNPADAYQDKIDGFYSVDFSSVLCDGEWCPVVFDGYPAMRDGGHFTRSYIEYLSKALERSLDKQLGGFSRFVE